MRPKTQPESSSRLAAATETHTTVPQSGDNTAEERGSFDSARAGVPDATLAAGRARTSTDAQVRPAAVKVIEPSQSVSQPNAESLTPPEPFVIPPLVQTDSPVGVKAMDLPDAMAAVDLKYGNISSKTAPTGQMTGSYPHVDKFADTGSHKTKLFALVDLPVWFPQRDRDKRGLFVAAHVNLRLFRSTETAQSTRTRQDSTSPGGVPREPSWAKYPARVSMSRAQVRSPGLPGYWNQWYLAADGRLRQLKSERERSLVVQQGGTTYIPEALGTTIFLILHVNEAISKEMTQPDKSYSMDVVFEGLESRQTKWGFYRDQALIEHDWDCDLISRGNLVGGSSDGSEKRPDYFLPEARPVVGAVEASLVGVVLRDASRVPVAAWRQFGDGREIILPGPSESDIPELIKALREFEPGGGRSFDSEVAKPFRRIGRKAVPALDKLLTDGSDVERIRAALVLSHLGPYARSAKLALARALADKNSRVVLNALNGLWQIEESTPEAISGVLSALQSESADIRLNAAYAWAIVAGDRVEEGIPLLSKLLTDADPTVRSSAARSLEELSRDQRRSVADSAREAIAKGQGGRRTVESTTEITNSIGMKLRLIPTGTFSMGAADSDKKMFPEITNKSAYDDERPQREVRIAKQFYLGVTEVTQGQWKSVMGTEPWSGRPYVKEGTDYPAMYVDLQDVAAFCEKLSSKERATYRLPTEAEWEYACRAGTITIFHFGDDPSRLEDYAWFRDNTWAVGARHPHRVAQKKPNAFGLFDMHGNVSEWCQPGVVVSSVMHRGGNWESNAWSCRSACRYGNFRDGRSHRMGFRVVKDSPTE